MSLLEEEKDCLNEDVLVTLLELVLEIRDSQVYKRHDITPLGPRSGRTQYGEGLKGGEDGKDKRGRENRRGERGGGAHCGNKVNPIVGESSGPQASFYHHII